MADIDATLRAFVQSSLRTVWALEVLLYLRRHAPAAIAASALVRDLRANESLVATCLVQLEKANLVEREGGAARYAPPMPALDALCDKLEAIYRERPVAVIDIIISAPPSNLKTFADAFRFREKDE